MTLPRILFVSTSSTIGGAEKTLLTLATRLDKSKYQIAGAVSIKPKGEIARQLENGGISVDSLETESIPGPRTIKQLEELVERTRPDVVHALMYKAIQLCRFVKRRGHEFRLISSPRVHYRSRSLPSLWLDRFLRRYDDLLISESTASSRFLIEHLGYDAARVTTIHNGVEAPIMKVGARDAVRQEIQVRSDEILLGAVGRLDEQKGYPYLLEAVAKLRVLHPVRAVIIGEGPLEDKLRHIAEELCVSEHVKFLPPQPEIGRWYAAMDIFVLPSLWEGLPNAVLEAMSLGLPVVATRVDGVPEAVEDKSSGVLCEPGDSQSLFDAIQELIVKPALRHELGETGRRRAAENFKLADMIAAYETAYGRVLSA